jgi:hypothetical protein
MVNPYGVQRHYDLELEERERRQGRESARYHEVWLGRRRAAAAAARPLLRAPAAARLAPAPIPLPAIRRAARPDATA